MSKNLTILCVISIMAMIVTTAYVAYGTGFRVGQAEATWEYAKKDVDAAILEKTLDKEVAAFSFEDVKTGIVKKHLQSKFNVTDGYISALARTSDGILVYVSISSGNEITIYQMGVI